MSASAGTPTSRTRERNVARAAVHEHVLHPRRREERDEGEREERETERRHQLGEHREPERRGDRSVGEELEERLACDRRRARRRPESCERGRAGPLPGDHRDDAGARELVLAGEAARAPRVPADRADHRRRDVDRVVDDVLAHGSELTRRSAK